ncbi:MAG: hypothetical protein CVV10_08590 [Gammaproteobacteria bacterium HGW-Gammaproteobacteria-14]|nr:MAG: hypothetical protein CVV10_08590 [Gammaproteobacteria bacterium HGW-Gammaproteobacteria-14]
MVGESGSGKSVTLRTLLRLHPERTTRIQGRMLVDGQDVLALRGRALDFYRGGTVSMVFQEPGLAFDPVYTIGQQITEAIRGEGGHLLLPDGERFMHRFDERGELAPRDIVARAIDHEMKRLGADCLYLDISHRPADFIINHFPTVYAKCLQLGIDITRDPIPVVPAAHYTCGGVITDLDGQTDLAGLYAIGETSFTGLHGANRMASNSLLECFVFGRAASDHIKAHMDTVKDPEAVSEWDESMVTEADEDVVIAHNWDELRRFMWDYVGIVRTVKRLQRASHRVELLKREITEYYSNYQISNDLLELRNLTVIAELIIRSALMRKESRGLHYMLDFPERADNSGDTILVPDNFSSERHKGH